MKKPVRIAKKISSALLIALMVFLILFGFHITYNVYHDNKPALVVLWLMAPICLILLRYSGFGTSLSISAIDKLRKIILGGVVILSVMIFSSYDSLRDYIGRLIIDGYYVYYYPGIDVEPYVTVDHWYDKVFLWLLEWGYLVFIVGWPILTWKAGKILISHAEENKDET